MLVVFVSAAKAVVENRMDRIIDGIADRVLMVFMSLPFSWRTPVIFGQGIIADPVRSQLPDRLRSQTPNVLLAGSGSTP